MEDKNITILYVDDEEPNLFIFKVGFQKKFNVILANSGNEALDILDKQGQSINAVISDMRMPLMDGVEFITELKKKYKDIPCYILTAFEYNDAIDAAIKNKLVNKFFTKPINPVEIETELRSVLN